MTLDEQKQFSIGMVVSCKRNDCAPEHKVCAQCVENFIGENVKQHEQFTLREITTENQSKQFAVSFVAHCKRPDCSATAAGPEEALACCTASSEKCEMCLRTIVGHSIRELYGFHAKEIAVV